MTSVGTTSIALRSMLACAATTLLSCGGGGAAGHGKTKDPSWEEKLAGADGKPGIVPVGDVPQNVAAITGQIWRLAARARQLTPKSEVKLQVLSSADLVGVVKKHVADEVPPEVIRGEGRCYAALGLIPYNYDYEAETYALLEEELAGLYIPEDNTMYLSKSIKDDDLDATLAHELVHALQEQYFSIGKRMKYQAGQSDALGAMQALAEGDATSAMIDEMVLAHGGEAALAQKSAVDLPDKEAEDMLSAPGGKKTGKINSTPRFLAVGLLAPYADGMRFVNGLRRRGGWKAVDAAWQKPPTTTEQLLHLDKYDLQEPAVKVDVASANALGAGWKKTFDDTFGEAAGRLAFAEWMDLPTSKRAAMGWGGDHVTLFENGESRAVVWRVVFDSPGESLEAFNFLSVGFNTAYGAPVTSGASDQILNLYGVPAVAPTSTPATAKKGKDAGAATLPTLPPLPDAPGVTPSKPPPPAGCRALRLSGRDVLMLGGAPCSAIAAWSKEVAKSP